MRSLELTQGVGFTHRPSPSPSTGLCENSQNLMVDYNHVRTKEVLHVVTKELHNVGCCNGI